MDNKSLLIENLFSNLNIGVEMVGHTKCSPDWRDIDYIPEYNKLYYILDGEGWIKIGDREYYPEPGQLFVMPLGTVQSYSSINEHTFLKYWCHFTARISDMDLFHIVKAPICLDVAKDAKLQSLFDELLSFYEGKEISTILKTRGIMLEILAWYFDNISIDEIDISTYSYTKELLAVLSYIKSNLSKNITVEELARIIHFHPNYFIRFFRDFMGCPPMQYINRMRLDRAKELLRTKTLSVREIAELTGFNDASYFSRSFKKNLGLSPLEYRNNEI